MAVPAAERRRWLRAAYLHDALKDAPLHALREWAGSALPHPKLVHGPAAAARAAREGETDRGVLDAVRYHSVGYAGWDQVGRMLYLADYLEPGRGVQDRARQALCDRVPFQMPVVLRAVARERIAYLLNAGKRLQPETVEFWRTLA